MKLVAFLVLGLLVFSCENEKKLSVKEIENQAAFEKQKHRQSNLTVFSFIQTIYLSNTFFNNSLVLAIGFARISFSCFAISL